MRNTIIAACLLLLTMRASAGADLQLAGHALGDDLAHVAADARFDCRRQSVPGFATTCHARAPQDIVVGPVPLQFFALHFDSNKLAAAEARLPELRHEEVAQALAAAFGSAKAEPEKLRAGMGGAFENAIYLWKQADTVLRLEQFFRSITTSSLILTTQAHMGKLVIPKATDPRTGDQGFIAR